MTHSNFLIGRERHDAPILADFCAPDTPQIPAQTAVAQRLQDDVEGSETVAFREPIV
jgi:hypothetical protein